MTDDELRQRLTERIRVLPHDTLLALDSIVAQLGGISPPPNPTSPACAGEQSRPHRDWPHAPVHRLSEYGTFLVTAGTLHRQHHFHSVARLDLLEAKLLELAKVHGWQLEAWAVFSNHYHFVGHSQADSTPLNQFLSRLHAATATFVNELDQTAGRQVWYNFWETRLTYERSYLARLNYVHQNAVKHGLVAVASDYRWCSAAWLERTAKPAQVQTIYSFKTDQLRVFDDFTVPLLVAPK